MRFEPLEVREMLAADSGWQAASYSMADDAQPISVVVAQPAPAADAHASLNGPLSDAASQLLAGASDLPPSDVIDTLRILRDLDAIQEYENGAAGLPGPGEEDVDPRTMVFDFFGEGSSKPELPGASQGDDRGQMLDAMLETFRGGASQSNPWSSPGESTGPQGQGSQHDPFERVGWAGQDHRSHGDYSDSYVDDEGLHYVNRTTVREGRVYTHMTVHDDLTIVSTVTFINRRTGWTTRTTSVESPNGGKEWTERIPPPADMEFTLEEAEAEPPDDGKQPDDGGQPNPEDDSGGLTFIDPDPWALFLAWHTGQRGSEPIDPYTDDPGGTVEGSSQGSAAPRVGIEAVINPGDSNFVTRPSGGSGRDPSDGPIGPPELGGQVG
jgi:hypothetical protein